MRLLFADAIRLPWLIFLVYWIVAGFRVNRMERREPPGENLLRLLVGIAGWYLLSVDDPRFGVLNRRFVGFHLWVFLLGAVFTWAGVAFAIWARYHIGRFWSASVALKTGHELIRTGPYSRIRHPIYTGILLALVGTALAVGRYRGIVAFAIILISLMRKSKQEESLLAGQFGPAFEEHRRHTGFFLPRFS
ncbi:MAG TPA: isoprenylcysteine carboxylmethyltransferase family protein [Candidatus Aquilonibacter sp.]|nr:isoprenylcysteine carboxylmethyltransferase family protein [Candidatus Aquilonibacter sp.]